MILTRDEFLRHMELLEENVYGVSDNLFLHDAALRAEVTKLELLCIKAAAWMRYAVADFEDQGIPQLEGRSILRQLENFSPEARSEVVKKPIPSVFEPVEDPSSIKVVVFQTWSGLEREGYSQILLKYGFECEAGDLQDACNEALEFEEGVFYVELEWEGSGEDSELVPVKVRPLNEAEKLRIVIDHGVDALLYDWGAKSALCKHCGAVNQLHHKTTLECPEAPRG